MDLNDFWQENKRFVMTSAGGALVFFTGVLLINNFFGSELTDQQRRKTKAEAALAGPLYAQSDLDLLRGENEKLLAAHAALVEASVFKPRPAFAPVKGSMATRYFEVTAATREELLALAGRMGIAVADENLGLPALAPNKDEQIERVLEGLDVVDRTLRLCFQAGLGRIEALDIKLDPRLLSGKPLEGLEKTTVKLKLRGTAASMARLVLLLQRSAEERVAVLEAANFLAGGARDDDARLELTLAAVRLHEAIAVEPEPPQKPKTPSKEKRN